MLLFLLKEFLRYPEFAFWASRQRALETAEWAKLPRRQFCLEPSWLRTANVTSLCLDPAMIEPFTALCNLYVLHHDRQMKSPTQPICAGLSVELGFLKNYSWLCTSGICDEICRSIISLTRRSS